MTAPADEKLTDVVAAQPTDLRAFILGYDDTAQELVTVAGWNGVQLLVKGLNAAERADFLKRCSTPQKDGTVSIDNLKFWPDLIVRTVYYPPDHPHAGERVFQPTDRDALNNKMAASLNEVGLVARRLSGLEENSQAQAKSEPGASA